MKRRLADDGSLPLIILLVFCFTVKGVHAIDKCCPPFHVLNSDLNDCLSYPNSSAINTLEFHGISLKYNPSSSIQPLISHCPMKKRSEYVIVGHNRSRNTFVVKKPDGVESWKEVEIASSQGLICVDAVLNYADELEGPFLYSCSNDGVEYRASVTKCCPIGFTMNVKNGNCFKAHDGGGPFQLPNRLVKYSVAGSSTRSYEISILEDNNRESCQFISTIKEIYANRQLSIGGKNIHNYTCIDYDSQGDLHALICKPKVIEKCPTGKICIPKCCELNEVFHYSDSRCVSVDDESMLYFPEIHNDKGAVIIHSSSDQFHFKEFHMEYLVKKECSQGLYKVNDDENIYLLEDGSLYHEGYENSKTGFCVDNFVQSIHLKSPPKFSAVKCVEMEINGSSSSFPSSKTPFDSTLSACESKMADFNANLRIVYTACGACSLFFLIITFFIYSLLPTFRNLHGKIVMSNIFAIFLTTLFLIIAYNSNRSDKLWCVWTGYSLYYSGLSMFCWMSVMCFDLCWTFVRAKIPRKGSDRLKFAIYSLIAWTIPGLFCGFIGTLDLWFKSLAPKVGKYNCFLSTEAARRFFYFPIFILLCFNAIMYLITIVTLWRSQQYSKKVGLIKSSGHRKHKASKRLNYSSSRKDLTGNGEKTSKGGPFSHINVEIREQLLLFTKLFLIMGLTWISECIHIEIHGDHHELEDCNFYLEVFLRTIGGLNVLRGFGFFVIFICKRSIYTSLKKKYPKIIKILSCCLIRPKQMHRSAYNSPRTDEIIPPKTGVVNETEYISLKNKSSRTKMHNYENIEKNSKVSQEEV